MEKCVYRGTYTICICWLWPGTGNSDHGKEHEKDEKKQKKKKTPWGAREMHGKKLAEEHEIEPEMHEKTTLRSTRNARQKHAR